MQSSRYSQVVRLLTAEPLTLARCWARSLVLLARLVLWLLVCSLRLLFASITAAAGGTAGYFRVYPNAATTTNAVIQGTAGLTGTDMILTANPLTSGQTVNFTSLTYTRGGA